MRGWLLVVTLLVWLFIVLLPPQLEGTRTNAREPDDLIADAMGGSGHESSDLFTFDFVRVRSEQSGASGDVSLPNSAAEFATRARAYALSFVQPSSMHDQEATQSFGGRRSRVYASSHPDKLSRHADSATSRVHH